MARCQQLPTFGAARLKREFDLPISHRAMQRIWREHGLRKPRRKKYQRKQDLAYSKAQWALFQQSSADTKDLADIPHYGPQAQQLPYPTTRRSILRNRAAPPKTSIFFPFKFQK